MNTTDATDKYAQTGLKSELARFCLPEAKEDPNRKLGWVNSICILFLLIGIFGAKPTSIQVKTPPPIEEPVPAIVEPLPPPPPTHIEATQNPAPSEEPKAEAPQVVVAMPDSPAIHFSVPTIANLVTPNAIAAVPPAEPLKQVIPASNEPVSIGNTGRGGERPAPSYPEMARRLHQQGTVVLYMKSDEQGRITEIKVLQSSGSQVLDRSSLDFVKRHWILPSGAPGRVYEAPIRYTF